MDSQHPDRGPILLIWGLAVIIFAGLVINDPANLTPLALVLVAYAGIARWLDPKRDAPSGNLTGAPSSSSTQPYHENSPKSRAA